MVAADVLAGDMRHAGQMIEEAGRRWESIADDGSRGG